MAIAIINGKRVEIDGPISGEQLANTATYGRAGRRAIMSDTRGVSNRTIERTRMYNLNDLTRDDGRPIKITAIPERVKGAGIEHGGSFFGHRSDDSRRLIRDQVYAVAGHMFKGQDVTFDEIGAHTLIIPKFVLPGGWSPQTTPLMVIFPLEYPRLPPTGFYMHTSCVPPHDKSGHLFTGAAYHGAFGEKASEMQWLRANNWAWYCAYIQAGAWSPAKLYELADWRRGDNLFTIFTLINEVLNERY